MNDWNAIRAYYRALEPLTLAGPANEWVMGCYDWDGTVNIRMTPIETWLWADIRANDAVLYPQYPVLNFFVDFGNPVAKVAIECDGAAYHLDKAKDEARDARLRAIGWTVYRITGSDCRKESDSETHEASVPHVFIKAICDRHGISRNSQTSDQSDADWTSVAESLPQWLKRKLKWLDIIKANFQPIKPGSPLLAKRRGDL